MAMKHTVTGGFGIAGGLVTTIALVTFRGYKSDTGLPAVAGPYCIVACQAYVPGAVEAEAYIPGAVQVQAYVPGAIECEAYVPGAKEAEGYVPGAVEGEGC